MPRDITVIAFRQPEAIDGPLTDVAREGARQMLGRAAPTSEAFLV